MKSGRRSCALAAASSSALGINRRKITHTSTSIWAMPVRSSAPIALRYSVSIRAWAHAKLIRQIVLTVTWTELKSSNAASLVTARSQPAPDAVSRTLGAVHDGHERSEFGRMQAHLARTDFFIVVTGARHSIADHRSQEAGRSRIGQPSKAEAGIHDQGANRNGSEVQRQSRLCSADRTYGRGLAQGRTAARITATRRLARRMTTLHVRRERRRFPVDARPTVRPNLEIGRRAWPDV
jgi:hypothetical protein